MYTTEGGSDRFLTNILLNHENGIRESYLLLQAHLYVKLEILTCKLAFGAILKEWTKQEFIFQEEPYLLIQTR